MIEDRKDAPIGVFDSGVGGLTVAREIMRQSPSERIVYFGDTARVPYGSKSQNTIIRYSQQIIRFLQTKQVKAIVVACNTATACALEVIQAEMDIPIMGVIQSGAKMAASKTRNGKIGVIGTVATIQSKIYSQLIYKYNPAFQVTGKACPLLVPLVEEGWLKDPVTDEVVSRYLEELHIYGIDTLILGCTHYPLLRSVFKRIAGEGVELVNPAYETASALKLLLKEKGIERKQGMPEGQRYEFYVSDAAERFKEFANSILPYDVDATKLIQIEEY